MQHKNREKTESLNHQGCLFVIAAPSGAGKTTLVKAVANAMPEIKVSISYTTRTMRAGEIHGTDYFFVQRAEFEQMIREGDFLEHATVFENYYGTSKTWVSQQLARGEDVILEIDWQGYQQIKRLMPNVVGIFILPPSLEALSARLTTRQQDNPTIVAKRLADVRETISHIGEFDYVVLNEDFNLAKADLMAIIKACRLTGLKQVSKLSKLINAMADFSG